MDKNLQRIIALEREVSTLRQLIHKKLGAGSADIKGKIVNPSDVSGVSIANNEITQAMLRDDIVGEAELKYELVTVTITAGNPSGTGTATSGSIIIGWRPAGNVDQIVDNIAISGTTVTVTLAANATAQNDFVVILIKA